MVWFQELNNFTVVSMGLAVVVKLEEFFFQPPKCIQMPNRHLVNRVLIIVWEIRDCLIIFLKNIKIELQQIKIQRLSYKFRKSIRTKILF